MDDHLRKLDTKIQTKKPSLMHLTLKSKIGGRDCEITPQETNLQKPGNSRNVINRRPRCDLKL